MPYNIIALDIDGTLTNSDKEITKPTLEALIDIQKRGCKVVLASGRPTPGVFSVAKQLRLFEYGSYIVSYNGAKIINCRTKEILYERTLPASVLPGLFEIACETGVHINTYDHDRYVVAGRGSNKYMELESWLCNMPIKKAENFVEEITFPMNKVLFSLEPEYLAAPERLCKERFGKVLNIYRSDPFFLEVLPHKVDKAHSLLKLLAMLGMDKEEMICCGDGYNDITMLECAGLGVAMENAQEPVKACADYITASNDEDGIVEVIEKFMLP